MSIKKLTDWASWWDGLRNNLFKCIGTTGTTWLGSNAVANIGVDSLKGIGLNWEQAIGVFGVHIGFEVFSYMRDNQPKVITITEDTSHITREQSGAVTVGTSSTTTTTPVDK